MNTVELCGKLGKVELDHEVKGTKIYRTTITTKRTSGVEDVIPVLLREDLLDKLTPVENDRVLVKGQFRSHNIRTEEKTKLDLAVFITEVQTEEVPNVDLDKIELVGFVCRKPNYRVTPAKRDITDVFIAVNRERGKSDYIPCIVWGNLAKEANEYGVGTQLNLVGRIQSRVYTKNDEKRVAYEVSVNKLDKVVNE